MQSIRNYIVKSEFEYEQSFTTEAGIQLFADKRFSAERLANKTVTVVELPADCNDDTLKPGYELMIDPTIYYMQNYDNRGDVENPLMVDRKKGLFKVDAGMIVLYRETSESEWKAFGINMLAIMDTKTEEKKVAGIVSNVTTTKIKAAFVNEELKNEGLCEGDEIHIKEYMDVPFWIDGKEYKWLSNAHILAKLN